jgi:hypothetical protein
MAKRTRLTKHSGNSSELPPLGIDGVRQHADALLRAARECCRQHDRFARLLNRNPIDAEEVAVDKLCQACNESLSEMAQSYEKAAANVRPDVDEVWWHKRMHSGWQAASTRGGMPGVMR